MIGEWWVVTQAPHDLQCFLLLTIHDSPLTYFIIGGNWPGGIKARHDI